MIKQKDKYMSIEEFKSLCEEHNIKTVKELENIFFGTYDNDYNPEYAVKDKWWEDSKETWWQRLNTLWVYPGFWLCLPFRYVFFKTPMVNEHSRLGKVIIWLTGNLK